MPIRLSWRNAAGNSPRADTPATTGIRSDALAGDEGEADFPAPTRILRVKPTLPMVRLLLTLVSLRSLRLLLALTPGIFAVRAPGGEIARPNVVILVADDLGWADVSCLNPHGPVQTPNIDRIANAGVKFTAGYVTAPLCGPSRAALFTGVYAQRFGFVDNSGGIPVGQPTYPATFRAAGYRTALIGKWHSSGPLPHARDMFDETLSSPVSSPFINYHHPKLARNGVVEDSDTYSTDLFAAEAEGFIERNRTRPFVLTVTFNAPHILKVVRNAQLIRKDYDDALAAGTRLDVPKDPTARLGEAAKLASQFVGDAARADTVATIAALDQAVGRILDQLRRTGLERNTIVFFLADNGGHPENRSENLPLRDYKWSVFEGGIRVPFLVSYPARFPAGREFSAPVSSLDIFTTCAAVAGVKRPERLDGVDLTPYLTAENSAAPHDALFFSMSGFGAVRSGPWKLVLPPTGPPQLFDLAHEVTEQTDLAAQNPERVAMLKAQWVAWNAEMPAPRIAPTKKRAP